MILLKTEYQTDKIESENKIHVTSSLVKMTNYDAKIADIEGKIPDVSNLATKTALTTVENKISSVSSLVTKTNYDTKVTEIENKLNNHNHDKYITTPEFNTLAADVFNARLLQANLVAKTDLDNTISSLDSKRTDCNWTRTQNHLDCKRSLNHLTSFDSKIDENKTKKKSIENEFKKLKTFDLSYLLVGTTLKKMVYKII